MKKGVVYKWKYLTFLEKIKNYVYGKMTCFTQNSWCVHTKINLRFKRDQYLTSRPWQPVFVHQTDFQHRSLEILQRFSQECLNPTPLENLGFYRFITWSQMKTDFSIPSCEGKCHMLVEWAVSITSDIV